MRRFLLSSWQLLIGLLIGLFTLTACEQPAAPKQAAVPGITSAEIIIGSTSALSGHASFLGTQYNRGAEAWFNQVNEQGGIHGRKIRLISLDDQYDPPKTIVNTEMLINSIEKR